MLDEAAPTVPAANGLDLKAYADELLDRFSNPALDHRLAQIAMDGSQKLPQRWLATRVERVSRGLASPAIEAGVRGWLDHLAHGQYVDDPLADTLREAVKGESPDIAWDRVFSNCGIVPAGDSEARLPG